MLFFSKRSARHEKHAQKYDFGPEVCTFWSSLDMPLSYHWFCSMSVLQPTDWHLTCQTWHLTVSVLTLHPNGASNFVASFTEFLLYDIGLLVKIEIKVCFLECESILNLVVDSTSALWFLCKISLFLLPNIVFVHGGIGTKTTKYNEIKALSSESLTISTSLSW